MNDKKRRLLKNAYDLLTRAESVIQTVVDEEGDSLDNMPENLADSDKCEKMEEAIECLENALESIDDAKEMITGASA